MAVSAGARLNSPLFRRSSHPNGVATFNDYSAQGNTNCGPKAGQPGTYGAAASDVSPNISGGKCSGSIDLSNCNGQSPINAMGPTCPTTNCGKCYRVTNQGSISATVAVGGLGNSVIVQIIDSCPQSNPSNYCKIDAPANQRCEDPNTNQLDIDQSAYEALTGQAFGNGPNLRIIIEDVDCPGGASRGSAASNPAASVPPPAATSANPPASVSSTLALPSSPPSPQPALSPSSPLQISPQGLQQTPAQGVQVNEFDAVGEDGDECSDEDVDTS